jgi:hypothetical protein
MITGAVMTLGGLLLGFYGSTAFNFGLMFCGWGLAAAGAIVFLDHVVMLW